MNRVETTEIRETHQRLKAVAKDNAPVTRRTAAQFSSDLARWREWQTSGYELPRLPRRLRVGLAKPIKTKKEAPVKKIIQKNVQNPTLRCTLNRDDKVQLGWLEELVVRRTHFGIALAITQSEQTAQDVLSSCTESALEQIQNGRCKAPCAESFHAWFKTIVRRTAKRRALHDSRFVEFVERDTQERSDLKDEQTWGVSKRPHDEQF